MIRFSTTIISIFFIFSAGQGIAADKTWSDHARPYSFLFGNHIDTHQELFLWPFNVFIYNKGDLSGWLYVFDSGETLDDGTPVLKHCTKQEHYDQGCVAGWRLHGKPCIEEANSCRAMFLYHDDDHPVWLVNPSVDQQGNVRGSRQPIYQPGSFTHMHWLTEGSLREGRFLPSSLSDVEAVFGVDISVPQECNVAVADALTTGVICPGYMLQLTALKPFGYKEWAFQHGGEKLVLTPGIDNKTHLNLLTSYQAISLPAEVIDNLPSRGDSTDNTDGGGNDTGSH